MVIHRPLTGQGQSSRPVRYPMKPIGHSAAHSCDLKVYALDGDRTVDEPGDPYTVMESRPLVRQLQPLTRKSEPGNGYFHGVFLTTTKESVHYHYERNPADPRVEHTLTLEVDSFGNVLKQVVIGYGRRQPDPSLPLQVDRDQQTKTLVTYTEHRVTNPVDDVAVFPNAYRTPLSCETRVYELTGYTTGAAGRFQSADFVQSAEAALTHVSHTEIDYDDLPTNGKQRRLIEHSRTLYRADDCTAMLPLGHVHPLALPGESYNLAFTPDLLAQVFHRTGESLLPDPANVLGRQTGDGGGYLPSQRLKADGRFPKTDRDDHWWIPTGRGPAFPQRQRHRCAGTGLRREPLLPAAPQTRPVPYRRGQHRELRHFRCL